MNLPKLIKYHMEDSQEYAVMDGRVVGGLTEAQAVEIIRRVNAHAQLVEACLLAVNSDSFVRLNPNIQKYIREALANATLTKEG